MNKNAIQYSFGEILNKETGTKYLEEIQVEKGQPRKAKCKCGYCGIFQGLDPGNKHYFTSWSLDYANYVEY